MIAIVIVAILLCIVWWIYVRYFRLSTFMDYWNRANRLEFKTVHDWEKKKSILLQAIELRKEAAQREVKDPMIYADNYLRIASNYMELWEPEEVMRYFDLAWNIAKDSKFSYSNQIEKYIQVYVSSGRKQRALQILNEMIKHKEHDKKFEQLIPLRDELLYVRN